MRDYVNSTALQEYTTKLVAKLKTLFPGTPTAAATVAAMTDHSKIYVYVGSETGYTAGDWYYWDGSAWASGGPFQATSIITDTTLAVAGEAADAKATGDAIAAAKTAVLNAMAPAYSTSATYAVGDYVNYSGAIYRCTTAITTAEAWTVGHWTEVPLGTDLADQVGALKESVSEVSAEYNLYDPTAAYTQTDRNGASRNGYTINADGSIRCIRSNGQYGTLFLVDNTRTLKAGTYTISGKMTCTKPGLTSTKVTLQIGLGAGASIGTDMTTERGGDTVITSGTAEGWFVRTFTLEEDKTFAFMCIPWASTSVDASYPATISNLMITEGSNLPEYSPNMLTARDETARSAIEAINEKMTTEYYGSRNLIGLSRGILYPVNLPAGTVLTMSTADGEAIGDSNFYLLLYGADKTQVQSFNFSQSGSERTVTISYDTYYLGWNKDAPRAVQVEIGEKTDYVPYSLNIQSEEVINKALGSSLTAEEIFNGEPFTGVYDYDTPLTAYGALFKGKSNVESFAFFTDPHVLGFGDDSRNTVMKENYLKRVQKTYNNSPCSFLVCGGDWLNNSTTMDEACYRLGNLKGIADHLLDGCKLVMGNHDTNYQGKLDAGSDNGTGRLTDATIASIMYRDTDTHKAYYSFDGAISKCYVLDTGIEHNTMSSYDWEQVGWLAQRLTEDDPEHGIIFLHIIDNDGIQLNASNFGTLVEAYNDHSTVTLNSIVYDFTACTGRIEFWAAGHRHLDMTGTLGGIPYVITSTNSYNSDVPLIDLMMADYDGRKLYTVRVGGTGEDRVIDLVV